MQLCFVDTEETQTKKEERDKARLSKRPNCLLAERKNIRVCVNKERTQEERVRRCNRFSTPLLPLASKYDSRRVKPLHCVGCHGVLTLPYPRTEGILKLKKLESSELMKRVTQVLE